jgi:hypothetical protein
MLCAAPSALLAQSAPQQPPSVRPTPSIHRPHPMPTGVHRTSQRRPNSNRFPVVIDSSVMDRYLTPALPLPPKGTQPPHVKNGQDVFETHSTDDAK